MRALVPRLDRGTRWRRESLTTREETGARRSIDDAPPQVEEQPTRRASLDLARAVAGAAVPLAAIGATIFEAGLDILPAAGLVDRLTLGRLLIILAVVALLVAGARLRDFRTGADIAIGLLIIAAAFTTVRGGWDGAPLRFLITAVATYYVVVATIRRLPNARSAIALFALTAVVASAGLGIAQVAEEDFTGFYRDGLEPITSEIVRPDLQVRAIGSFINPNLLASFIVLLGPIGFATAAWVPRREMRWAVFGLTALAYIGLVFTFSRSAILGAILGALLVVVLLPAASPIRKATIWTAAGLAVVAIAAAAATAGRAVGAFGRVEAWDLALEAAADEPVTGVGLGRSGDVIVALGGTDETFAHAHNLWLNWLTEAGPLAFLAIAFLTIWLVVEAARGTRRGDAFMAAALAGMVGFLVISLTDHPANAERIAITFWVVAGVIAASGAPSFLAPWLGGPDDSEIERPPPVLVAGALPVAAPGELAAAEAPVPVPETPPAAEDEGAESEPVEAETPEPEPIGEPPSGLAAPIPLIVPLEEPGDGGDAHAEPDGNAEPADGTPSEPEPAVLPTPFDPASSASEAEAPPALGEGASDAEAAPPDDDAPFGPDPAAPPTPFDLESTEPDAGLEAAPEAAPGDHGPPSPATPGEPEDVPALPVSEAGRAESVRPDDEADAPAPEPAPPEDGGLPEAVSHVGDGAPAEDEEEVPPALAGADDEDDWPSPDAADTGEIPRPPELAPEGGDEPAQADDREALAPSSLAESEQDREQGIVEPDSGATSPPGAPDTEPDEEQAASPEAVEIEEPVEEPAGGDDLDDGPADAEAAPEPLPGEPLPPPPLFFDQNAEEDATESGPLGTPSPLEPEPSEPVAFYDHAAEPSPPTPDPISAGDEEGEVPPEALASGGPQDAPPAPPDRVAPSSEDGSELDSATDAAADGPDDSREAAGDVPEAPAESERLGGGDAWMTFESVADDLRSEPGVTSSTMMAAPSLRRHGKYFAALWHDSRLAVKLPRSRSRSMIDEGVAEEFAPAGRTLDEWVLVSPTSREQWRELLEEAKAHAGES